MGVRPLAYRMKAHKNYNELGRFVRLRVQVNPKVLKDLERQLKIADTIIRFTSVRIPLAPQYPHPGVVNPRNYKLLMAERNYPFRKPDAFNDLLRRTSTLDYYGARTLLKAGLVSRRQIAKLTRWKEESPTE